MELYCKLIKETLTLLKTTFLKKGFHNTVLIMMLFYMNPHDDLIQPSQNNKNKPQMTRVKTKPWKVGLIIDFQTGRMTEL